MTINWPSLMLEEYAHGERTKQCLNAGRLNSVLQLKGRTKLIEDRPPCFFAGRIGTSKMMLLSLNPGFKGKRNLVEYCIFNRLGWEETYLSFFKWFEREGLSSPYYSRFAVFLSGYLGKAQYLESRKERFRLLDENLVNIDLVPYHSLSFTNRVSDMLHLLDDYVKNLQELIELADPDVIFLNGAIFKKLLDRLDVVIGRKERLLVNRKRNTSLEIYLGHMALGSRKIDTVWFTNFLTGRALAATNEGLFEAGKALSWNIHK